MKSAILLKISKELNNDIDTEPKVLYLLAEIRKCIDRGLQIEKRGYPNLYFYCNWILHIEMDRKDTKEILNRIEAAFPDTNNLKELSCIFKKREKNFYSFLDLKEELRNFLNTKGLSVDLIEKGNKWFRFKKLLVEILIDCPLTKNNGRVRKFSYEKGDDEQITFRVDMNKTKNKTARLGSFKFILKEK